MTWELFTIEPAAITMIIREYTHKFKNLEEKDRFLENYKLPKPNQGKVDNVCK